MVGCHVLNAIVVQTILTTKKIEEGKQKNTLHVYMPKVPGRKENTEYRIPRAEYSLWNIRYQYISDISYSYSKLQVSGYYFYLKNI